MEVLLAAALLNDEGQLTRALFEPLGVGKAEDNLSLLVGEFGALRRREVVFLEFRIGGFVVELDGYAGSRCALRIDYRDLHDSRFRCGMGILLLVAGCEGEGPYEQQGKKTFRLHDFRSFFV